MSKVFSTYDPIESRQSVYCYKDSDTLINIENIKDAEALAEYEADITLIRQYELETDHPITGRFGITHLKRIHKYIFQDIYPFAGKFRIEKMSKGSTPFCDNQFIEQNLENILGKLKQDNYLRGLNTEEFSLKAAYYMAELNMVHPFREGNGRSIREFIRQLALGCGYIVDWSLIESEALLEATIISVTKVYEPLARCIFLVIDNK